MNSEKLKVKKKTRNEGRPGYQKTKVGWIPEEWQVYRLKDIAALNRGKFSARPRNDPCYYVNGSIPFVQTGDVSSANKYVQTHSQTLNTEGLLVSKVFPAGTILITIAANIGDVGIIAYDMACPDSLIGVNACNNCDQEWLFYFLLAQKRSFESLAPQNAQKNINLEILKPYPIPLPPLPEQKKIAEILSAWDRAIEQVGRLIDAKERLKKGLMQQLLTGRMRFPEFGKPVEKKGKLPEGWKLCKLGACFKERKETNPDLPLLAITSDRGVIPRDEVERKDTSNADKSKYKRIAPGDIGYNTMRMWQGVSAVSTLEGIVSPAYTICTPKKGHSSSFFGYLFKYPPMIHLFHRFSQGLVSDTLNLKFRHFSQVKANVPSEAEQTRIAAVLSACDREIELLKKGLMQKLLTGEIRHPDFLEYSDIPGDSINDNQ